MESKKAPVVLSKDQLLCHFFEAVDTLLPPAPGEKMDANASFVYNHALGLKICKQITLLTKALRPMTETKRVQVAKKTRVRDGHGKKSVC